MAEESTSSVVPIRSPWRDTLLAALKQVQQTLFMICPYIKEDVIAALQDALVARPSTHPLEMRVITRALPDEFLSGSSDITALQRLLSWPTEIAGSKVEIRAINNVHAKVWIFDHQLAFVGSGNATPSGLQANLEYGLAVSDPNLVELILQDWQTWWDQASPVDALELEKMQHWLAILQNDAEIRQFEAKANERRKVIERKVGPVPRIGKRLSLRDKKTPSPQMAQPSIPYTGPHIDNQPDELDAPKDTPLIPSETIYISTYQLQQALSWTFPLSSAEPTYKQLQQEAQRSNFLKIAWKPSSLEHSLLQCTWADGKRLSQATIVGHSPDVQHPWTITLGRDQLIKLTAFLHQHMPGRLPSDRAQPDLQLSLQTSPHQLLISQTPPAGQSSILLLCTPASAPGSFPSLQMPISQLIVEHTALQGALIVLNQQRYEANAKGQPPSIVELCLTTPGAASTITLSAGPIDAPLTETLPARDCILAGPDLRLRLGFVALQQVLLSSQGHVNNWHICIGRDAETVQFIPEPGVPNTPSLQWRHELQNITG